MDRDKLAPLILGWDRAEVTTRRYYDGQHIFLEGEKKKWIYCVESGAVCLYNMSRNGQRQIVDFRFRGDLFALEAPEHYTLSAKAKGTTRLNCLPAKALHRLSVTDPAFAKLLYRAISAELVATREFLAKLCQHNSTERVALFFLSLSGRIGGNDPELLSLPMIGRDIADFLGMKIETLSRVLTKLCEDGLIEVRGRWEVRIQDMQALCELAGETNRHKDGP
jgi:CRP/FNR family transcriptional regulator, anaerobic regulatory protein